MEGALSHALTVARTEQLRVYRESSRQQYESTGAVLGYKRFAAKDGLTCALCLALDGEIYKTNELMNVHPCDRCTMIPVVRGVSEITWESGEDWLRNQPEEVQRKTLGPGAHEMWKNGDIELKDLVNKVDHPIWGPSLQRNTLASLREEAGILPTAPSGSPVVFRNMSDDMIFDIDNWGTDNYKDWVNGLSADEARAIAGYRYGDNRNVNATLRHGADATEETLQHISDMQSALNRSTAVENLVSYRSGYLPVVQVGDMVVDKGFMSTSLRESQARHFMDLWGHTAEGIAKSIYEIRIPEGTPGAFVDNVKSALVESQGREWEFLLPPGIKMKVISAEMPYDVWNVVLEIIP